MHIALLTRLTLAHAIRGGMERYAATVMERLHRRGHRFSIITTALPSEPAEAEEAAYAERIWYLPQTTPARYTSAWWEVSAEAVQRLQREDPLDLVWSQSIAGLGYLRSTGRDEAVLPFVATMHGTAAGELRTAWQGLRRSPSPKRLALVALRLYQRWRAPARWADALPHISALIAVSAEVGEELVRVLHAPPAKVQVIPNGVDVARFAPDPDLRMEVRRRLGLSEEAIVLIGVGRLDREKGYHQIVELLARMDDARLHFLLAGKGREAPRLRKQARRLGVAKRIHLLGFVPHQELPGYYNAADLFVMPTLCREGFPLAIVEAMACSLPVIANDSGGISMAVREGETGYLLPMGDMRAFRASLEALVARPALRREIGARARREVVARFSLEAMADATEALFRRATDSSL